MNERAGIRSRSYATGDWYGVIGPHVTVILPPQEKARVAALWALADEGADFDEVLDALISGGLRDLSGFVLLADTGADADPGADGGAVTLAVVRGTARVSFVAGGERVELAGSQSTTWVERSLREVTSMVVELQDVPDGARSYPIEQGLVRLGRLSEGTSVEEQDGRGAALGVPTGAATGPAVPDTDDGGELLDGAPPALVVAVGGDPSDHPVEPETAADSGSAAAHGSPATVGAEDLLPLSTSGSEPLTEPLTDPLSGPWGTDEVQDATDPAPVAEVDSWIDPGPASAAELAGPDDVSVEDPDDADHADAEVTELLPVDAPSAPVVDPEGTEPMTPLPSLRPLEPLGAAEPRVAGHPDDDLMQDFARDGDLPEHDDDPLGLGRSDDLGRDALGLVAGGSWPGSPVDPGPFGDGTGGPGLRAVDPIDAEEESGDTEDPGPHADDGADRAAGAGAGPEDHDGATRTSPWDEAGLSLVRPGIAGQEPAPAVTSRPVARLVISDGRRIEVDRVVVLGRAPSARRFAEDGEPLLVRVDSPHQEISATHLEIRPGSGADHGTAVVTDLGSTNGTVVAQPGLEPDELEPGVSVQLIPGAIIDLGDGVTLQVVRP